MKKLLILPVIFGLLPLAAYSADVSAERVAAASAARGRMPSMPTAGVFQSINMTSNAPTIAANQPVNPPQPPLPPTDCGKDPNVYKENERCFCKNGYEFNKAEKICECKPLKVEKDGVCKEDESGPKPKPKPDCPGNTVDECMKAILSCVNGGGLPGGLSDLYNSDLRHAIMNGMNLCAKQVDWCIENVRVQPHCKPVYRTAADVWLDFNSRVIQPNYYSFVLRKTGLTPHQAENTCLLLDRNSYGASFTAVSASNKTTSEFNNRINAYNGQGGSKANPQGVQVNNGTASTGAAAGQFQQKNVAIQNRGGGVGGSGIDANRGYYARWDATAAECVVRVAAYNKDKQISNKWLFGALGDDKEAEAWVKAGENFNCGKDLFGFSLLNNTSTAAVVGIGGGTVVGGVVGGVIGHNQGRQFDCNNEGDRKQLWKEIWDGQLTGLNNYLDQAYALDSTQTSMDSSQCEAVVELRDVVAKAKADPCYAGQAIAERSATAEQVIQLYQSAAGVSRIDVKGTGSNAISSSVNDGYCALTFKRLIADTNGTLRCQSAKGCLSAGDFKLEVENLNNMLSKLSTLEPRSSKTVQGVLIGAGTGAAAGGLATAITAFVERNNISCRIGDGLERVGFGKGGKVDSLKEYYVKWNLNLPDTIMPTAQVADCKSWGAACGMIEPKDCADAQINFKPKGVSFVELIDGACALSGSVCVMSETVAASHELECEEHHGGGGGHEDKHDEKD
jgi:hypothetical protein